VPIVPRLDFVSAVEFLRDLNVVRDLLEKKRVRNFKYEYEK